MSIKSIKLRECLNKLPRAYGLSIKNDLYVKQFKTDCQIHCPQNLGKAVPDHLSFPTSLIYCARFEKEQPFRGY